MRIIIIFLSLCNVVNAGFTTLVNNGPSNNRVDMVFMGDGYTLTDINNGIYNSHINNFIDYITSDSILVEPYNRYQSYFNIHSIELISNESGADSNGIFKDTVLNASYSSYLRINILKAIVATSQALESADFKSEINLVVVNDSIYGGSSEQGFATFAGQNKHANELALHEIGHSFSKLKDEYFSGNSHYSRDESIAANITNDSSGEKWSHWLGYEQDGIGTIGVYEGALGYSNGIYRPSLNSKMRNLYHPFDAIAREKIILDIYDLVDPLDSWTDNSSVLENPLLEVSPVDVNNITTDWYVNNQLVLSNSTEFLSKKFLSPGLYSVIARSYDNTEWVRINKDKLEQNIEWSILVSNVPEPNTLILLMLSTMFCVKRLV